MVRQPVWQEEQEAVEVTTGMKSQTGGLPETGKLNGGRETVGE